MGPAHRDSFYFFFLNTFFALVATVQQVDSFAFDYSCLHPLVRYCCHRLEPFSLVAQWGLGEGCGQKKEKKKNPNRWIQGQKINLRSTVRFGWMPEFCRVIVNFMC